MSSYEKQLEDILAELRRHPRLLQDPRIVHLLEQANIIIQSRNLPQYDSQKHNETPPHVLRKFFLLLGLHVTIDIIVVFALWHAQFYVPDVYFVFNKKVSSIVLVLSWLLLRAEALRVVVVEAADWLRRHLWHGALWFAEVFHPAARRAWRRSSRARALAIAWQRRPKEERKSYGQFLAFLEQELRLSLSDIGQIKPPPDWFRIEGWLGRLSNPYFAWPGDKRLLPSQRHWILHRAVRLADARPQASAASSSAQEPIPVPEPAVPSAPKKPEDDRLPYDAQDIIRIQTRIKTLEEEIRKIQSWNVTRPAEEESRSALIREKREEINALRESLRSRKP